MPAHEPNYIPPHIRKALEQPNLLAADALSNLVRTVEVPLGTESAEELLEAPGDILLSVIITDGKISAATILPSVNTVLPDSTYVLTAKQPSTLLDSARQMQTRQQMQRLNALAADLGERREWDRLAELEADIQELRERPIDQGFSSVDVDRLLEKHGG